jgi:hypothetical protein
MAKVADSTKMGSPYAVCFDEGNVNWQREPVSNQTFIAVQEQYATDRLRSKGHLVLNDVYRMLGFPDTPEGAVVGWLNDTSNGDGYVSFGVWNDEAQGERFVSGGERSVWLDFNVDGPVWNMIGKVKK